MKASALRLSPGDDLRGALESWARQHNVRAAYVATCVGFERLALADAKGQTLGGHLGLGTPIHTTAEIVVVELTDIAFARELDPATNYRELVIRTETNPSGG